MPLDFYPTLQMRLCKKEKSAHSQLKSADGQLVVKNFNKVMTKSCHSQLKVIGT
jgi:hypothetical protein